MRSLCLFLAAVSLLAALSCVEITRGVTPSPSDTPPADPQSLRWQDLPVTYCLDLEETGYAADDAFARLVERAFATWGVPATSEGRCDGGSREGNRANEIGWGPAPEAQGGGVYEAGHTRIRYTTCGRGCPPNADARLIEADILIDTEPPLAYRNEGCLYSALVHEVGHLLGLPHLPPPAVMSAVSRECSGDLTEADRQALLRRYGEAP